MGTTGRNKTHLAVDTLTKQMRARSGEMMRLQEQVRVLVADDDDAIRETLRVVFEEEGYQVDEASNGRVTIDLMQSATEPYIVVLDLMMPQLGGDAVLEAILEDEELGRHHAILLVTADSLATHGTVDDLRARLQIPLIRKPFDLDTLLTHVERAAQHMVLDTNGADTYFGESETHPVARSD
jgi:CheY-like chemotaxis protein